MWLLPAGNAAQLGRWCAATFANAFQFISGVVVLGDTPLPDSVLKGLGRHSTRWSDMFGIIGEALASGFEQALLAAIHHPFITGLIIWWAIESWLLVRQSSHWLQRNYEQWKRGAQPADLVPSGGSAGGSPDRPL
jgi:hypothetical protein